MTMFSDKGAPAWSRMFEYLESRFGVLAPEDKVAVLPFATPAAWDDRIQEMRLYEMYKWGDWMPSFAWQYAPNTGKRISNGYQYFLSAATVAHIAHSGFNSDVKTALTNVTADVDFARQYLNAEEDAAARAYQDHVNSTPVLRRLSRATFYMRYGYNQELKTRQTRLDSALADLDVLTQGLQDPDMQLLKNALVTFHNPKQQVSLPPSREVLADKDLWQTYYISLLDKSIDTFLSESRPQSQSISEQYSQSSYFEQHWSASVSVDFLGFFHAGGASAEQTNIENHVRDNTTQIDISFSNLDTFPVVRGEWYNQNVIDRFASLVDRNVIFGPGGQLEVIPKSVLVGKGMTFTVYADDSSLDYMYQHIQASADARIAIGWWTIGGSADYSTTKAETSIHKYSDRIVFEDLTGRGQVLAVLSQHLLDRVGGVQPRAAMRPIAATMPDSVARLRSQWSDSKILERFLASERTS